MQNTSSYSNPPHAPSSGQSQPLEYLQRHVADLTAYINENNQKYHKNMVTLKQFYQEQAQQLHDQNEDLLAENNRLNNEIITVRDMLGNANIKNRQLEQLLGESEKRQEEARERIEQERKRNELMYHQMETIRVKKEQIVDELKGRIDALEEQNRRLAGQLFSRETNIDALNKNVESLSSKVNESYLLPHKIEDLEKGQFQYQTKLKELHLNNQSLQQQLNSANLTITKLQSENESLKIFKANNTTERKLEIQKTIKQQKQTAQATIGRLETEKQNYVYQLNDLESRVKVGVREREQLQEQLLRQRQQTDKFEQQAREANQQKAEYVSQFGSLKNEYEAVIQRLEDALIQYQNKNYKMEEQNKDLHQQLSALQELLQQVRSINTLQAHRPQYRKMAEMQLLARQRPQPQPVFKQSRRQGELGINDDSDKEWQKLMKGIEMISL